jgi:hypothetical protein
LTPLGSYSKPHFQGIKVKGSSRGLTKLAGAALKGACYFFSRRLLEVWQVYLNDGDHAIVLSFFWDPMTMAGWAQTGISIVNRHP